VAGTNAPVQPYVVEHTQANLLHASGITGKGVTIVFLDTGWWSQHATQTNTAGQDVVLQGYDATNPKGTLGVGAPRDGYGHGRHVLSIAANSTLSQDGTYIGMAPDAARVIVRAFDKNGQGSYANVIQGMNWILANAATYHIRVVNMSFGAKPQSFYWNDPMDQAVMKLWQAGIVVVASAGNSGPTAQTITAPGGHVIGVLQDSSTIGNTYPQFPGTNGYLGSTYFYMSGTSMSAAVVSGAVALMLEAHPALTPTRSSAR
jgi:serine protease AprX